MGLVGEFLNNQVGVASQGSSLFKAKDLLKNKDGKVDSKALATGAGIGAAVGGITGGVLEHGRATAEVQKLPVESVTLDWTEPVTVSKNLGKIPQDHYQPGGFFGIFPRAVGMEDVVRKSPIIRDDGTVAMQQQHKTFTDHGNVMVQWKTREIRDPFLNPSAPYTQSIWEDAYWREDCDTYRDSNGDLKESCTSYREVRGYWVRYSPNIEYKTLGSYEAPEVTFETGVSVGLRTFLGVLAGMGLGALSGALLAVVAKRVMESYEGSNKKGSPEKSP